jgi:hypothetical protein
MTGQFRKPGRRIGYMPTNQLQTSDWIQIFVAIGQIASGVGALVAAYFAYRSTREMKNQSIVLRDQFISQYGPKISVEYILENHLDSTEYTDEFPCSDIEVNGLPDGDKKDLFLLLCHWWNHPARNACPSKYVVIKIQNTQADMIKGVAREVTAIINVEAKLIRNSFPSHLTFSLEFKVGDIQANQIKRFPIRIEGIPSIMLKLESMNYFMGSSNETLTDFFGQTLFRFPID